MSIAELTWRRRPQPRGLRGGEAGYVQSLAVRYDADRRLGAGARRRPQRATGTGEGRGPSPLRGEHRQPRAGLARVPGVRGECRGDHGRGTRACWSRAWAALVAVGAEQEAYAADADPVTIYLGSLRALIASGRVHVAGKDGGCPPENPVRWGWTEGVAGAEPLWRPQGELVGWVDGARPLPRIEHRV